MAVALVDRGIGSQAIEITAALDVIHPDAFSALQHNVERMIVVCSEFVLQVDKVLGTLGDRSFLLSHGALSAWPIGFSVEGSV
jgi:hypothetical protein